ncbi:MAG: guanylate cyclase [Gammaproteobacteria bacterium RIFCSPLOWO2_12_47_11]|nr:MAG: guanylate cyclase [Gammaproteobacteria bacterium RIFCSPLOWO2_12_47_11]
MKVLYNLRRNPVLIALNVLVLSVLLANTAGLIHLPFIDFLENYAYDARMLIGMKGGKDPRIVIVDIDEKSLAAEGRWPWSRNKMARLLDQLFDHYQVSLVGFDILFAEPDKSSGLEVLEYLAANDLGGVPEFKSQLEQIRERLDYDNIFAKSMSGRAVVLGYYFNTVADAGGAIRSGVLPSPTLTRNDFRIQPKVKSAIGYGANLPELQANAVAAGHFNPDIDVDGIVRRVPLLYEFEGNYYESMSLAMSRQILGVDRLEPLLADDIAGNYATVEWFRLGHIRIPVDEFAQAIVPYRGKQGSFPYVSATDVLNSQAAADILEDTIVLIGTSAPGLFDLRSTPVQNKFPGVEIHANLIAGILDQGIKELPKYVQGIEFIHLFIAGLIITLLLPFLTPVWSMLATTGLLLLSVAVNYIIWHEVNIVLPVAAVVAMILILLLLNMSYGFFFERRIKGQITDLFGQYVPPELVDEMSEDPASYIRDAEERELTVLFSDVRGFTTLSEGLTPKELSSLMNEFLSELTRVIHDHRGTIDKYMGDAIMAFWGAPVKDPDHAKHALTAGLAMIERMYALQDVFEERGWPRLYIGVGLNTGNMSVGNMGSRFRTAYTVIGDEVNLGSRLEGLTKEYGVELIVGENTKNALPDYVFRELDLVRVKGKHKPIGIYQPLALYSDVSKEELEELEHYQLALDTYRAKNWDDAEKLFEELKQKYEAREVYNVYLKRLDFFRKNPPGTDWDGVFTFTTK